MSELFNDFSEEEIEAYAAEFPTEWAIAMSDRAIQEGEQRGMMAGFEAAQAQLQPMMLQTTALTVNAAEQILKEKYRAEGIELTQADLNGAADIINRGLVDIGTALTNPHSFAERLDAAISLHRGEAAQRDRDASWERIKNAGGKSYIQLMSQRPRSEG